MTVDLERSGVSITVANDAHAEALQALLGLAVNLEVRG